MRKFTLLLASQPNRPKEIEADSYSATNGLLCFFAGDVLILATSVTNVVKLSEIQEQPSKNQ